MSCNNCVRHVETALSELAGVKSVKVNLKKATADIVLTDAIDNERLISTLDEAGYTVINIEG